MPVSTASPAALILDWYDRHGRDLPWRAKPGETIDPYRTWLSEIMLQQTTVAAVKGYFERFLDRWPTVVDLAAADLDDVLSQWAGLGYYARARNLHKCAQVVAHDLGGRFPNTQDGLKALPGIGDYTSAAIAALAFDRHAVVVDGNVERVMARVFAVTAPLPGAKKTLKVHAATLTPDDRCGDYAQAVMDLGATVCTPRSPKCSGCPWREICRARAEGIAETLPRRAKKADKPVRHGVAFLVTDGQGKVLLRRRPETGLLGGMTEVPSTDWVNTPWTIDEALAFAPIDGIDWTVLNAGVEHVFTHFRLKLTVVRGRMTRAGADGFWAHPNAFDSHALPSVMRKITDLL